ncbi:DUF3253 domain-containing protein [Luteolibacter flavescens]|uniref:DUF3253 domain-containing protein n=1 Tax=Luteolibacter flavescens TaxID=1859460 RepID=A0ABT3FUE2_9BACT|nr:DUF3253 domain-containing protein [Luteolibacter flavescens]MCW1886919.1 DUF3253 domain-containing protein [Luteolibacter flavescens]
MGSEEDGRIGKGIMGLLGQRTPGATICPSEVSRELFPDDWRERMDDVRRVARHLESRGEIEVVQKGRVVDPATAKGPIRLRRRG